MQLDDDNKPYLNVTAIMITKLIHKNVDMNFSQMVDRIIISVTFFHTWSQGNKEVSDSFLNL